MSMLVQQTSDIWENIYIWNPDKCSWKMVNI